MRRPLHRTHRHPLNRRAAVTAPLAGELVLVIAALTLTLWSAVSVSVLPPAQATLSLTLMSPLPLALTVPCVLWMVMLLLWRLVLSMAPLISPPLAAMV
jgi:hypothetical protein